ncbi:mitochondria-eating protein [Ammospiza nelsoni]|uniref:mitochondria-eating protein n=1 Tax=Ammospiza caudacuta TaxID=2857398 RepID=UPI00273A4AB9|nr:mitochondria-eating protein [Ammospiza caudacuta]XP_059327175.1 mitochondria-eating protein [Ammospiza nelsoni]
MAKEINSLVGGGNTREMQDYEVSPATPRGQRQPPSLGGPRAGNLSRCCEVLEPNKAIQKQLFSILNETSQGEDCAAKLKGCLLPSICTASGSDNLTQESAEGELQLRDLSCKPRCELQELEDKLSETRVQINQMERDLKASRCHLKRLEELDEYEQKIENLRDEIAMLDCKKSVIQSRPCMRPCPPKCRALCPRPCTPPRIRRGSASHRACLIARYNFIYAKERLEAECILRRYVCNLETVQRIVYIACVESFRAAKMAFWRVKINVKDTLGICFRGGPTSLEVAVLDYIACHKDLYDVCCSVHEVVCCMNRNPKLPCPGELDFVVISNLIREVCCLAYSMQTLIPPLDIAYGVDGECFNRNMYYRSFDSDFAAPFVAYHVWPPLVEDGTVIVKGEVVTKKMVMCPRRCRIRSRSCSCGRPLLCGVPRSRSLSTVRVRRRC